MASLFSIQLAVISITLVVVEIVPRSSANDFLLNRCGRHSEQRAPGDLSPTSNRLTRRVTEYVLYSSTTGQSCCFSDGIRNKRPPLRVRRAERGPNLERTTAPRHQRRHGPPYRSCP